MEHNARWILPNQNNDRLLRAVELAASTDTNHVVAQMLMNRGIHEPAEALAFLNPSMKNLHHPHMLPGAKAAAERLASAIKNGERIVVFGDYDVDGITATTTMYHALRFFGADVETYLPHRTQEGYGIKAEVAEKIILGLRPKLIITVDCGITAVDVPPVCKKWGVDFIVTDHHEWKAQVPETLATVHPFLGDYPNRKLCGAGVAFKVAWALGLAMSAGTDRTDRVSEDFARLLQDLLCFTALGTIADCMPLVGENRVIAVAGLSRIHKQERFVGLQALIRSAGIKEHVDGYHVGFTLAPRINAAGRMGHADDALKMFTRDNRREAELTADELAKKNKDRQTTERRIAKEAIAQAEAMGEQYGYVLCGDDWFAGVVGIVGSRITERFRRPAIVLHKGHGNLIGGSGRSVDGFNIANALKACEDLLTQWGGHAAACGVKLEEHRLEAFREAFNTYCKNYLNVDELSPKIILDAQVGLEEIDHELTKAIKSMGPFGHGNRRPNLYVPNVVLADVKTSRDDKHLFFTATQGLKRIRCVAFGEGEYINDLPHGPVDLAVEPEFNHFNGNTSVQLMVKGVRPAQ